MVILEALQEAGKSPVALAKLSDSLPSTIEKALNFPTVREMIAAAGEDQIKAYIEFELIKLANLLSIGGNLNDSQVVFIAQELIKLFPNESIADFKLCFQRGAIGQYGEIFRMDGIVIRSWMEKYLEEKYQVLENKLVQSKENPYGPDMVIDKPLERSEKIKKFQALFPEASPGEIEVMINKTPDQWIAEFKKKIEAVDVKAIPPMTDKEIHEEGQLLPKQKTVHPYTTEQEIQERNARIRELQEKAFRERYPKATDDQVAQFLKNVKRYEPKSAL
jgi:hypothetical protein